MRLKSLEIKGFKSFADKTVINFNQDITGIVGPNGCGKSNVVDAIRWVLGEQKSRELRSESMSSVIFNGTQKRKAGGLAQVSMTFENTRNILPTEYQTVTITRMLYRSGESEYRLNNIPCRLKDITSLFLDTGIGSDSYAIIALNMVDDLLNDRDNSRRRLFEQAAGISKFKKRKKETLNKLKGTEADLDRVEDLLFEIETNLKSLEKQARRTRKYFELKEQYKTSSIELAVADLSELRARYKKIKADINGEEEKRLAIDTSIKEKEAALEKEKSANLLKEKELSDRQKVLNQRIGQIRTLENDKKVYQQKIQFIQQNQTNLFNQIESSKENLAKTERDILYYKKEVEKEKETGALLEAQLQEAEETLKSIRESHGHLKSELEEFVQEQQDQERRSFELEKKLAINKTQKEALRLDIQKNNQEILNRKQEVEHIRGKITIQKDIQQEKEDKINSLRKDEDQRKIKLEGAKMTFEKVEKEIVNLNRKLDAKRNEYKLTKSLVDNLEGFPESIKFLSRNKKWTANAPLLSDILFCPEEYRITIENYLDNYLNYYVADGVKDALSAIRLLSQSQNGKANFFLMDELTDYQPLTLQLQPPVDAFPVLKVIKVEARYQPLVNYLLGNVWITDNDDPKSLGPVREDMVLLSRSGNYSKSRFTMAGGSVGLFEGKRIGRKKNLEVLNREINDLEDQGKSLSSRYDQLQKEIKALRNADRRGQLEKEVSQLNAIQRDAVSLNTKLENFEVFLKDVQTRHTSAEEKIKEIEALDKSIEAESKNSRQKEEQIRQRVLKMDQSYRAIAEELSNASADFNQRNIEYIRQQNKIQVLQRELSFRESQLKEIRSKITSDTLSRQLEEEKLNEAHEAVKKAEEDLIGLYQEKSTLEQNLNAAEQNYYQSRGLINEAEEAIRKMQRQQQQQLALISQLKDKFNEVKFEITAIGERLRVEFGTNINELINEEPAEDLVRDNLAEKVDRLKRRLDNYGEINPMAVEAYDEIKERYDFISNQREDLLKAKESLLETIQEIEKTATEHFLTAFNQVRDNFRNVFRNLFSENDDCDLFLENEQNPLESAIRIVAKPKGKRPQSINQLSGGEKTLTATALLFSLYLLKPAPFCIFDEVDAPLDDANIAKFNRIIKKFSTDSQFIIVTHNKQTMAAVDVIYGITMHEQGVSMVAPVDFSYLKAG